MSSTTSTRYAAPAESVAVYGLTTLLLIIYALRDGTYDVVAVGEAGVLIWWGLLLGLAAGVLPRALPSVPARVLIAGLVGICVWMALAFAWTESDERTHIELALALHHLGLFVLALALLRRETAGPALAGAATAGAIVCLLAVGSRLWPGAFPEDPLLAALDVNRLNYPFNYWNALAAWSVLTAALALAWSVHARSLAWRAVSLAAVPVAVAAIYMTFSRQSVAGLALAALAVVAFSRTRVVAGLHLVAAGVASGLVILSLRGADPIVEVTGTGGRGGVLAALLAAVALCAVVPVVLARAGADERLVMDRRHARRGALLAAVAAVVVVVVAIPTVVVPGIDDITSLGNTGPERAGEERFTDLSGNRGKQWRAALNAFGEDPLTGTGPGTFEFWWNRQALDGESVRNAHSLFFETLGEQGIVGLALLLVALGGAAAALVRFRQGAGSRSEAGAAVAAIAAAAAWTLHAGVDWMWEQTAVTTLLLVVLAAACAGQSLPGTRLRVLPRAALAFGCLLAILALLPPMVGTSRVRESQRAATADRIDDARAAAQEAVDAWPWAATPLLQRALVNELAGEAAAAEVDVRRAERREPTNWRHALLHARLAAEQGETQEALEQFRRARELRPVSPIFRPG